MKPKLLYYQILQYQEANIDWMNGLFDVMTVNDPREDTDSLLQQAEGVFAPLGFLVDEAKIERCPHLKVIISNTTSIPHIDVQAASRRGIQVCALHDEQVFLDQITPTAEHTIGLLLAAWRRIPAAHAFVCQGGWNRRPWGATTMLSRMRLGIIGYGRLGRKVAAIATAMGMTVKYYDPSHEGSVSDIMTLAQESDVLSIHATGGEKNRNLVSRAVLEKLPAGALVVNTARGELLDTEALLDLLESGHLRAAALDTIDGEYFPEFETSFRASRILQYAQTRDNLVLTPHIGGSTVDAWFLTERRVLEKAAACMNLYAGVES